VQIHEQDWASIKATQRSKDMTYVYKPGIPLGCWIQEIFFYDFNMVLDTIWRYEFDMLWIWGYDFDMGVVQVFPNPSPIMSNLHSPSCTIIRATLRGPNGPAFRSFSSLAQRLRRFARPPSMPTVETHGLHLWWKVSRSTRFPRPEMGPFYPWIVHSTWGEVGD
jgi:hypothetical protein